MSAQLIVQANHWHIAFAFPENNTAFGFVLLRESGRFIVHVGVSQIGRVLSAPPIARVIKRSQVLIEPAIGNR